jgi:hypothetical protein
MYYSIRQNMSTDPKQLRRIKGGSKTSRLAPSTTVDYQTMNLLLLHPAKKLITLDNCKLDIYRYIAGCPKIPKGSRDDAFEILPLVHYSTVHLKMPLNVLVERKGGYDMYANTQNRYACTYRYSPYTSVAFQPFQALNALSTSADTVAFLFQALQIADIAAPKMTPDKDSFLYYCTTFCKRQH